jgi:nucleotide-binding universal stress UspA family protein
MPKTIIVPLDGSDRAEAALEPARKLARQSEADVVLLMAQVFGVADPAVYLESTARGMEATSVRTVVCDDRLAVRAIQAVAATEPDAIVCMTTHARSGPGQAVFGSIAEEVIRRTDVPLVLVGPSVVATEGSRFEELVVCLDGSPAAAKILPIASEWAGTLGLGVWLVGVVDPDSPAAAARDTDMDVSESMPLQRAAQPLQGRGFSVNWETLHGNDAARAIVGFAETRSAPLIAMTTHGRGGLTRVTTGSVTMSVVHHASCPVLLARSTD